MWTCVVYIRYPALAGEMNDADLQAMVMSNEDIETPLKAVSIASQEQNFKILSYAVINSPNPNIQIAAVEAISKCPRSNAIEAFIQIIQSDALWDCPVKGGPGQIAQNEFIRILGETIYRLFGVEIKGKNMFDPAIRKSVIQQLQKSE